MYLLDRQSDRIGEGRDRSSREGRAEEGRKAGRGKRKKRERTRVVLRLAENSIWLGTSGLIDNIAVCPLCSVFNPVCWNVVAECLGSCPGSSPTSGFLLIFSLEAAA